MSGECGIFGMWLELRGMAAAVKGVFGWPGLVMDKLGRPWSSRPAQKVGVSRAPMAEPQGNVAFIIAISLLL